MNWLDQIHSQRTSSSTMHHLKSCGVLVFHSQPRREFLLMRHAKRYDLQPADAGIPTPISTRKNPGESLRKRQGSLLNSCYRQQLKLFHHQQALVLMKNKSLIGRC